MLQDSFLAKSMFYLIMSHYHVTSYKGNDKKSADTKLIQFYLNL
jgi:hypothetical protein